MNRMILKSLLEKLNGLAKALQKKIESAPSRWQTF